MAIRRCLLRSRWPCGCLGCVKALLLRNAFIKHLLTFEMMLDFPKASGLHSLGSKIYSQVRAFRCVAHQPCNQQV